MELFDRTSFHCSKLITANYSTSFTLGIKALDKKYRMPIYAIYGFVRYADEIVDTFHQHDKRKLLEDFSKDTFIAIEKKISLNPVLHSFQMIVNEYNIDHHLIHAFLKSMEMDLHMNIYDQNNYLEYIYGSAEVVGLMCLKVFCEGNNAQYEKLKMSARSLGSAFQKVNFLRDIKSDYKERKRIYFPDVDFEYFTQEKKDAIEKNISKDFEHALNGIRDLPEGARWGVYLAYIYYTALFKKIKKVSPSKIMEERIRVSDNKKLALLVSSYFQTTFNTIRPT